MRRPVWRHNILPGSCKAPDCELELDEGDGLILPRPACLSDILPDPVLLCPSHALETAPAGKVEDRFSQMVAFPDHDLRGVERADGLELTPSVYQLNGALFMAQRWAGLISDDKGLGKGQPANDPVLTPDGPRAIGSLSVGDYVMGRDGKPTHVTAVHRRGVLPVFLVTCSDGASVCVDADHLWAVKTPNDERRNGTPWRIISTRGLIAQGLRWSGGRRWRLPLLSALEFAGPPLSIDPYLLGVLIADGSLSKGGVSFTPGDELVPLEVAKVLPFGIRLSENKCQGKASNWSLTTEPRSAPNPIKDALRSLGLDGTRSHQRFVPKSYLYASAADRLSLLQGLMDTDGELQPRGWTGYSSTSERLAEDVVFLARSLGGTAKISYRGRKTWGPKGCAAGEKKLGRPSCIRPSA